MLSIPHRKLPLSHDSATSADDDFFFFAEALIRQVYRNAGLNPADCGVVEAHGTGTKVGDPIEASAIHQVLAQGRDPKNPLFIGSVKSNIGHLEAASGIVAVIKAALMLERGFILPNYDYKKPNEKIPFGQWNLKVRPCFCIPHFFNSPRFALRAMPKLISLTRNSSRSPSISDHGHEPSGTLASTTSVSAVPMPTLC